MIPTPKFAAACLLIQVPIEKFHKGKEECGGYKISRHATSKEWVQ